MYWKIHQEDAELQRNRLLAPIQSQSYIFLLFLFQVCLVLAERVEWKAIQISYIRKMVEEEQHNSL